jgi:hypothetical protein
VDLADEMLEESLELLDRSVGGGQEVGRIEAARLEPRGVVELGHELAAIALHLPPGGDRVAALEAQPDPVGVAEDTGGNRSRSVAQAQGEIRGPGARREALLLRARVAALEPLPRPQGFDLGTDLRDRRLHVLDLDLGTGSNPWLRR